MTPQASKKCDLLSSNHQPSSRFLHKQRHQCGTDFRRLLHTHNLFALSAEIKAKQEKVPDGVSVIEIKG